MTLTVLDIFSGIGGFSLGLERTGGFKTVAFCEIEPYCRAVLRKHWSDVPIFEDVTRLRGKDVGQVDVICGGFPCTDIAAPGRRAGLEGKQSGLWADFARLIRKIRPQYVIVENSPSLLVRGMGRVLGDLADVGMDAEWHGLPAAAFGAPHYRARQWILAYARNLTTRPSLSAVFTRRRLPWLCSQWHTEPGICRVDDGISNGLVRNAILGNAVVPQIVEVIGQAILEADQAKERPAP